MLIAFLSRREPEACQDAAGRARRDPRPEGAHRPALGVSESYLMAPRTIPQTRVQEEAESPTCSLPKRSNSARECGNCGRKGINRLPASF
jgi:hypothetical protein